MNPISEPQATCVVTVEVTQEDIDHGVEGSCENCPIARAVQRAVGARGVNVDSNALVFWDTNYMPCAVETPPEFAVFMANFDNHGREAVEPFTYELSLPAWVVEGRAA